MKAIASQSALLENAATQVQANRYYYLRQIANKLLIEKIVNTK